MMKKAVTLAAAVIAALALFGCGSKNLHAKEGEPANGFLWENNYSEITITGYQGASNDIEIPQSINGKPVTKIAEGAFSGFKALNSLSAPGCVKTMANAFRNCDSLTKVTIETGAEDINGAFSGCSSLMEVRLPDSIKNISGSFAGCTSLKEIVVPDSVENMEEAFSGCTSLEKVNIPAGATELSSTFVNCTSLKSMEIPQSVTSLVRTFSNCTALTSVTVAGNLESMTAAFSGCTALTNVQLQGTVSSIREAFYKCSALKSITIPEGVTDFADAFVGCSSLEELTFAQSIAPGEYAEYEIRGMLKGCDSLKSITASREMEEMLLETKTSVEYTISEETDADWYTDMVNKISNVSWWTHDWEPVYLPNGEKYLRILSVEEGPIAAHEEDETIDAVTFVQKKYFPAYNKENTDERVIICETQTMTKYFCLEGASDRTITINGTQYPVYHAK